MPELERCEEFCLQTLFYGIGNCSYSSGTYSKAPGFALFYVSF